MKKGNRSKAAELACVISDALDFLRYDEANFKVKNAEQVLTSALASYREWSLDETQENDTMSASEAVFGFCAWLTTRGKVLRMSAIHECGPAVDAISLFCKTNNLDTPRAGWEKNLTHPKEEYCEEECDDYDYRDAVATALKALSGDFSHNNVAKAKKILKNALK